MKRMAAGWSILRFLCVIICAALHPALKPVRAADVSVPGSSAYVNDAALEAFARLSKHVQSPLVAPGNVSVRVLDDLNQRFTNQHSSPQLSGLLGTDQEILARTYGNVVAFLPAKSPEPDFVLSNNDIDAVGLKLLASLTTQQVATIQSDKFVTAQWLTPDQQKLYCAYVRADRLYEGLLQTTGQTVYQMTDKQIIDFPYKFFFSSTASVALLSRNGQESSWVGIYDYLNGQALQDPLAGGLPEVKPSVFSNNSCLVARLRLTSEGAREKPLLFPCRVATPASFTLNQVCDLCISEAHIEVHADKRLNSSVFVGQGTYAAPDLLEAVAAASGTELRPLGDAFFIGFKRDEKMSQRDRALQDLADTGTRLLNQHQLPASFPLQESLFDNDSVVPFADLSPAQQKYLHDRLQDRTLGIAQVSELGSCKIHFRNTLWLQGEYTRLPYFVTPNGQLH